MLMPAHALLQTSHAPLVTGQVCDSVTTLTKDFGLFSDGDGPYARNTDCVWHVQPSLFTLDSRAPIGTFVTFAWMDVEDGYDFVEVYEGRTTDEASLLHRFTGTMGEHGRGHDRPVQSVGTVHPDGLTVRLVADTHTQGQGFLARWNNERAECLEDVVVTERDFGSHYSVAPGHPAVPTPDPDATAFLFRCKWTLWPPKRAMGSSIWITVHDVDLAVNEVLEIWDGGFTHNETTANYAPLVKIEPWWSPAKVAALNPVRTTGAAATVIYQARAVNDSVVVLPTPRRGASFSWNHVSCPDCGDNGFCERGLCTCYNQGAWKGDYCHVRAQRFLCDSKHFNTSDGCDCSCNFGDPDCAKVPAPRAPWGQCDKNSRSFDRSTCAYCRVSRHLFFEDNLELASFNNLWEQWKPPVIVPYVDPTDGMRIGFNRGYDPGVYAGLSTPGQVYWNVFSPCAFPYNFAPAPHFTSRTITDCHRGPVGDVSYTWSNFDWCFTDSRQITRSLCMAPKPCGVNNASLYFNEPSGVITDSYDDPDDPFYPQLVGCRFEVQPQMHLGVNEVLRVNFTFTEIQVGTGNLSSIWYSELEGVQILDGNFSHGLPLARFMTHYDTLPVDEGGLGDPLPLPIQSTTPMATIQFDGMEGGKSRGFNVSYTADYDIPRGPLCTPGQLINVSAPLGHIPLQREAAVGYRAAVGWGGVEDPEDPLYNAGLPCLWRISANVSEDFSDLGFMLKQSLDASVTGGPDAGNWSLYLEAEVTLLDIHRTASLSFYDGHDLETAEHIYTLDSTEHAAIHNMTFATKEGTDMIVQFDAGAGGEDALLRGFMIGYKVVWCDAAVNCTGHGFCSYGGRCVCDFGWAGVNCERTYWCDGFQELNDQQGYIMTHSNETRDEIWQSVMPGRRQLLPPTPVNLAPPYMPAGLDCQWRAGFMSAFLDIEYQHFSLNGERDFMEVYEGWDDRNGLLVANYSLYDGPPYIYSVDNTTSVYMKLETHDDVDVGFGVLAYYTTRRQVYVAPWGRETDMPSASDPLQNIRQALPFALNGSSIILYPGRYAGANNCNLTFNGTKDVRFLATDGWRYTILDCEGSLPGIEVTDHVNMYIEGLQIRSATLGLYVHNSATVTLVGTHFTKGRNAMWVDGPRTTLDGIDCIVSEQKSRTTTILHVSRGARVTFDGLDLEANHVTREHGIVVEGASSLVWGNSTVDKNLVGNYSFVHVIEGSALAVSNSLWAYNSVEYVGGVISLDDSVANLTGVTFQDIIGEALVFANRCELNLRTISAHRCPRIDLINSVALMYDAVFVESYTEKGEGSVVRVIGPAAQASIVDATMRNSTGAWGAGVAALHGASVDLKRVLAYDMVGMFGGGVFYVYNGSSLSSLDSSFWRVTGQTGGVAFVDLGSFFVSSGDEVDNAAALYEGGVVAATRGSEVLVDHMTVTNVFAGRGPLWSPHLADASVRASERDAVEFAAHVHVVYALIDRTSITGGGNVVPAADPGGETPSWPPADYELPWCHDVYPDGVPPAHGSSDERRLMDVHFGGNHTNSSAAGNATLSSSGSGSGVGSSSGSSSGDSGGDVPGSGSGSGSGSGPGDGATPCRMSEAAPHGMSVESPPLREAVGGFASAASGSAVTTRHVSVLRCSAHRGGCLWSESEAVLHDFHGSYSTALADQGGWLAVESHAEAEVLGSAAEDCRATGSGGCVAAFPFSMLGLEDVTMRHGTAAVVGGCTWLYAAGQSTRKLNNVTMSHCDAGLEGGGLFVNNTHVYGIGVHVDHSSSEGNGGAAAFIRSSLWLHDSSFNDNHANQAGGGVYAVDAHTHLSSTGLARNTADREGGGFYALSSDLELRDSAVDGNDAVVGGGLRLVLCPLDMHGSKVSANRAVTGGGAALRLSHADIGGTSISDNTAVVEGGGVLLTHSSSADIADCAVSGNGARLRGGGGVACIGCLGLTIDGSSFTRNFANEETVGADEVFGVGHPDGYGIGGIALGPEIWYEHASGEPAGHVFAEVSAHADAIRALAVQWEISSNRSAPFIFDVAAAEALLRRDLTYERTGSPHRRTLSEPPDVFGPDYADNRGGGIHIYSPQSKVRISDSTISSNSAGANGHGGGLYTADAAVDLESCVFHSNYAGFGAGVFDAGPVRRKPNGTGVSMADAQFFNNEARGGGGGVFWHHTEPNGTMRAVYSGNVAGFGPAAASPERYITVDQWNNRSQASNWVFNEPVYVRHRDFYGQTVTTLNGVKVWAANGTSDLSVFGDIEGFTTDGIAQITNMGTVQRPGTRNKVLRFWSENVLDWTWTPVSARECWRGEVNPIGADRLPGFRCDVCPRRWYSWDTNDQVCTVCPLNAICLGGDHMIAMTGYYRMGNTSFGQWDPLLDAFSMNPCLRPASCIGAPFEGAGAAMPEEEVVLASTEYCAEGYRGVLCQMCSDGYGRTKIWDCETCPDDLVGIVVGKFVLIIVFAILAMQTAIWNMFDPKHRLYTIMKVAVSFFQVTAFIGMLNVDWPSYTYVGFSFFDLAFSFGFQGMDWTCMMPPSQLGGLSIVYKKMLLFGFAPALTFLVPATFFYLQYRRLDVLVGRVRVLNGEGVKSSVRDLGVIEGGRIPESRIPNICRVLGVRLTLDELELDPKRHGPHSQHGTDGAHVYYSVHMKRAFRSALWRQMMAKSARSFMVLMYIAYPNVTRAALSVLNCRPMDDGNEYVVDDPNVMCWSMEHWLFSGLLAFPSLLFTTLGLPYYAARTLTNYKNKKDPNGHAYITYARVHKTWGFLFLSFPLKMMLWELVVAVRKLLLVAIIIFLHTSPGVMQSMAMTTVLAIDGAVHYYFHPYKDNDAQILNLVSSLVSVLTIIAGVLMKAIPGNIPLALEIVRGVFVYVINVGFVGLWVFMSWRTVKDSVKKQWWDWKVRHGWVDELEYLDSDEEKELKPIRPGSHLSQKTLKRLKTDKDLRKVHTVNVIRSGLHGLKKLGSVKSLRSLRSFRGDPDDPDVPAPDFDNPEDIQAAKMAREEADAKASAAAGVVSGDSDEGGESKPTGAGSMSFGMVHPIGAGADGDAASELSSIHDSDSDDTRQRKIASKIKPPPDYASMTDKQLEDARKAFRELLEERTYKWLKRLCTKKAITFDIADIPATLDRVTLTVVKRPQDP